MILVDTSIWIEFFRAKEPIMAELMELIRRREVLALECVFGELLQGTRDAKERTLVLGYWENLPHVEDAGHWLTAGIRSAEERWISQGIGLIDAAIITSARHHRAKIWSLDKKLNSVLRATERFTI